MGMGLVVTAALGITPCSAHCQRHVLTNSTSYPGDGERRRLSRSYRRPWSSNAGTVRHKHSICLTYVPRPRSSRRGDARRSRGELGAVRHGQRVRTEHTVSDAGVSVNDVVNVNDEEVNGEVVNDVQERHGEVGVSAIESVAGSTSHVK